MKFSIKNKSFSHCVCRLGVSPEKTRVSTTLNVSCGLYMRVIHIFIGKGIYF